LQRAASSVIVGPSINHLNADGTANRLIFIERWVSPRADKLSSSDQLGLATGTGPFAEKQVMAKNAPQPLVGYLPNLAWQASAISLERQLHLNASVAGYDSRACYRERIHED
jgi:hypothetical protein